MKMLLIVVTIAMSALCVFSKAYASPLSVFNASNGWTQFANDDGYRASDGYVNPGYGGQLFDAEYLFYKLQNNILSIGLQTGFNVIDGHVIFNSKNYYSGDLALSFDGNSSNYEYAADFGLFTKDYYGDKVGNKRATTAIDTAGIYKVSKWNNDVYSGYQVSSPFAMDSGLIISGFDSTTNRSGSGNSNELSYYRIISFSTYLISEINSFDPIKLSAHWTMSCGNDAINGSAVIEHPEVPEPKTMFLLGSLATGLFGLAGLRKRFTK